MKTRLNSKNYYYAGILVIVLSSFSNHVLLPFSPSLFFYLLGLIILFFSITQYHLVSAKISTKYIVVFFSLQVLYLILSQLLLEAPMNRVLGILISTSYFFVAVYLLVRINIKQLKAIANGFINFSIVLLIIEFVLRIVYPINIERVQKYEQFDDNRWIYKYKESSFMYFDSNGTAIHLLIIVFTLMYLYKVKLTRYFWIKLGILTFLVLVTFSRAGIIALLVGYLYFFYFKEVKISRLIVGIIIFSCLGIVIAPIVTGYFKADLSLQTKFDIYNIALKYFDSIKLNELFFGIGITNSMDRFGIYTHNYLLTYFIETGLIGCFLQVFILLKILKYSRHTLIVFVPFFVANLTSMNTYIPYFYTSLALIVVIDLILKNGKRKGFNFGNNTVL
jgi:hypothetical protein